MKSKFIKFTIIAIIAIIITAFYSCDFIEMPKDGLSAYEIAVKNGFVGNEQEWLDSLKGPQGNNGENGQTGMTGMTGATGKDGENGESAYDIAVKLGFSGSESDWIASLNGKIGDKGETGEAGKDGVGIQNVSFDKDGNLIITLTNGNTLNAGNPNYYEEDSAQNAPTLGFTELNIPVNSIYVLSPDRPYCKFESSDPSKVQVTNDGLVIAHSEGSAEITVTARDGKSSVCRVNAINFTYKVLDNGTLEITGYTGMQKELMIPATIKGVPVTSIGNSAFADYFSDLNIVSVYIPGSISSIGSYAFCCGEKLEKVFFNEGLVKIGNAAFSGCISLASVELPESLEILDNTAFNVCESLKSISIPSKVTSVGGSAFYGCTSLETVTFGSGVKSIGMLAFGCCTSLTSVTIPENIKYIDEYAFSECTALEEVILPEEITYFNNSFENTPWFFENQHSDVMITDDYVWATQSVKIRTMPSLEFSQVYDYAAKGDKFKRIGTLDAEEITWAKVEIGGQYYYISMNYLTTQDPNETDESAVQ